MRYLRLIIIFLVTVSLLNCEKDAEIQSKDYPFVLTQSLNVYQDSVKLIADLICLGDSEILRYGFVCSTQSNPTIANINKFYDLEPETGIYSAVIKSGLKEGTRYYVRSYVQTDIYEIYGNEISFISNGSLQPIINSFTPTYGPIGTQIIIYGENFGLSTQNNIVYFGDTEVIVDSVSENKLVVTIPEITESKIVKVTVETAGKQTTSEDMFDLWFPWLQKNDRTGIINSSSAFFSINDKGYVISNNSTIFLIYDAENDEWDDGYSLPENSGDVPLAFSANEKAYVLLQNYFWEFNPNTNIWTQKEDFPGTLDDDARKNFGMNINNNVYIGSIYYDFWEYDTEQNAWEQKADFIGDFDKPVWGNYSFSMEGYGFLGVSQTGFAINTLWQYSLEQDLWTSKTALPSVAFNNYCTFVIEGEAFVGLGSKFTGSTYNNVSNEIWKYSFVNDSWTEYNSCPVSMAVYANFSINNKGYAIGGFTHSYDTTVDVWEFDPTKN